MRVPDQDKLKHEVIMFLKEQEKEALRITAFNRRESMSAIAREAVLQYLANEGQLCLQ